jgi:CrcB protein
MNTILAIFVGGGLGSLARYGVSVFAKSQWGPLMPWGTLLANVLSCIVLGLMVFVVASKIDEQSILKPLIILGFCGGFSTFSTFSFETVELIRNGQHGFAIANVLVSVLVCVAILYAMARLVK